MHRQPFEVTDPVVIRALAHPLRRAVLSALRDRVASSSELAEEFGESLPKLSYHVRQLAAVGLLDLVEERPVRAVKERFYTAAGRTHVSADVFDSLPDELKTSLVASWLSDTQRQLSRQLQAGSLASTSGRLNRGSFLLDGPSQRRLGKAIDGVYQLALQLEEKSRDKKSLSMAYLTVVLGIDGPRRGTAMMDPVERDVRRVDFGYFVRPESETGTGAPQVEPVLGYLVRCAERWLLFDTGMGAGHDDLDAHYRPVRRPLLEALATVDVSLDEVAWVANCHLHFDHCGGNPELVGRPIFAQELELRTARERDDYTLPELVSEDIDYRGVTGQTELFPGIHLVPTPGHVQGHQSLVIRRGDGTVICAGQSHDSASFFTHDALARRAEADGVADPLPVSPAWMDTLLRFDPARVVFAHDLAVWEPR